MGNIYHAVGDAIASADVCDQHLNWASLVHSMFYKAGLLATLMRRMKEEEGKKAVGRVRFVVIICDSFRHF